MNRFTVLIVSIGVVLVMAAIAPVVPLLSAGQSYYVATTGVDAVPGGTASTPWRTLQFAVDHVAPGDTILVQNGEYVGCRIEQSGTSTSWITLQAAPGASVRITAPGPRNKHSSNIEIETWEGAGTVAYWIIEGLEVSGAPSWGIDMRGNETTHSHHLVVRGNLVHHNGVSSGRTGIFTAFVDDVLIENNESYSNGEHGIYTSNSGDRPTIRGNRLHHNVGCGVHMNGDASMDGDGTISNGVIEQNVIYENGTAGGSAINMDGVRDTLVRNNLLYQNHAGGIAIFQQDGAICSQNNRVLNNTIVMASDGRWAVNIADAGCINNHVFNNIIYSYHSWRGSIVIPASNLSGFESDYNVVMDRLSADGDSTVITLAAWQALGYDAHSFIATPDQLFVNAAAGDYHLREGSPAINAGTTLVDVVNDLDGHSRPMGPAYDIGADEFVSIRVWLPVVIKGM